VIIDLLRNQVGQRHGNQKTDEDYHRNELHALAGESIDTQYRQKGAARQCGAENDPDHHCNLDHGITLLHRREFKQTRLPPLS
jgi:hypothetical protein